MPRTAGTMELGLALIAGQPSLSLSIEVKDEFGRAATEPMVLFLSHLLGSVARIA